MDRAADIPIWAIGRVNDTTTGPERKPLRSPVFIHDAVTPWGRETLLLALWREQQARDQDE